jgi:hypothetical protein
LPRALKVAGILTVETIADVRLLVEKRLPAAYRDRPHWRMVASVMAEVVAGADVAEVEAALMVACAVEGIACRRVLATAEKRKPRRGGARGAS